MLKLKNANDKRIKFLEDYRKEMDEPLGANDREAISLLREVPGILYRNDRFYIDDEKVNHINKLVQGQKQGRGPNPGRIQDRRKSMAYGDRRQNQTYNYRPAFREQLNAQPLQLRPNAYSSASNRRPSTRSRSQDRNVPSPTNDPKSR